jgi:hypothetical protein
MRVWVITLALALVGCGAAAEKAPASPAPYHRESGGGAMPPPAPPSEYHMSAESVSAVPGSATSTSPSMAGSFAGAEEASVRKSTKKEADNDSDGIPDAADRAPSAGAAPPPPPPPPQNGQPKPEPQKDGRSQAQATQGHDQEFLVYTANLNVAVYLVDQAINQVEQIARENGGFLASRGDNAITIRVPRSRFQATLAQVEKTGDVLHRDVRAQDVTDEYMDLEVRIKNARAMRDQLAALLAKANVKEAIEIERELGRVTEELERMQGQLKLLRDKIAYSTITVTYAARGATIQSMAVRLPFPWLSQLGLPSLLRLEESK